MTKDDEILLIDGIKARFGQAIIESSVHMGEVTHTVKKDSLVDICRHLKSDREFDFNFLSDVIGVDYHPRIPRFEVVYHLLNLNKGLRLRLKIAIEDGETVPTVVTVWRAANWPEREAFDMFGIVFEGHPDLRRIYLAPDWEGFPLRKDYPLRGYKDRYNPFGEERS